MNGTKNFKHSHNDYWNKPQLLKALKAGCNIFEADVIYQCGEVLMSHSWRPFKWMTYGEAESYFQFLKSYVGEQIYLYIEIKTSDYRIVAKLYHLIQKYGTGNVTILINGINRWFSKDRYDIAMQVLYFRSDIHWFPDWKVKKKIERVELYKSKSWYKRLNHW